MLLEDSYRRGAVHFSVESEHPYPFSLCYCSICFADNSDPAR
jgi:hypothetical protein